ncbi:MAG: undecaprenyl-diphosphatase UppP [Candidatus Falkowbacteria bacterium]|nr:undecaprenyl-diphosphatase UppP [Candidatus Falkowbacteria bacterium]
MNIIQSLILGIVEGLSEFLPISSTAHLIIASKLLAIPSSEFLKTFEISIQLGAIAAVVVLYWRRIWQNLSIVWKLAAAFVPTAIIGLILYKIIKNFFMESLLVIGLALFIGGILLIIFEKWYAKKNKSAENEQVLELENISYRQAAMLGVAQSVAMIPGVSRSAATIVGGLGMGIKRKTIVEFSFLLAIPTMLAATVLDIYKNPGSINGDHLGVLLVGLIAAFVTAMAGIKFFIKYIQKNDFKAFGWYRIIIGALVLISLL